VRPVLGVLGVDGGGSKTHALVADERGEVLGFASSGRSNWEDTGLEAAGAALAEAVPCWSRWGWPGPGGWRTTRSSPCGPGPAGPSGWW
jgi:hypothetical protein